MSEDRAQAHRHPEDPPHRLGADRHRPGLRVRLLGHPGRARRCARRASRSSSSTRNPATIMTDPEMADRTYIEPLTPEFVAKIIERERPDALLPTLGGQTALNLAVALAEDGTLDRYGVELIGAKLAGHQDGRGPQALQARPWSASASPCPDRRLRARRSRKREAHAAATHRAIPPIIRPSLHAGRHAAAPSPTTPRSWRARSSGACSSRPVQQVLIEESVIGWKEFELEVMRDLADNVVIICSIENFDPMGVHTGDSITVAPAQTLTDKEYQLMRDAAVAIIREIGVETGGSNIQFARQPRDGRHGRHRDEPARVALLGAGLQGHRLPHRQDRGQARGGLHASTRSATTSPGRRRPPSSPRIDYCVVKFPRWAFEKFPEADQTLTTQMKSVGEVMAIGRTFKEALQKAVRSLEQDRWGLDARPARRRPRRAAPADPRAQPRPAASPSATAYRRGLGDRGDPRAVRASIRGSSRTSARSSSSRPRSRATALADPAALRRAKQLGFADRRIADADRPPPSCEIRRARARRRASRPVYKMVDTCAAEFVAHTPVSLLDLRGRGRGRRRPTAREGHHPGLRAQPHRPGHRVRLLLRPRRLRAPRAGRGGDHGQLQPRDGLDRLRHLRPAVLRAAHAGGRPQHRREGAAARRHRPVRRPDAAQAGGAAAARRACPSWARRPTPSTAPRTASASTRSSASSACARPPAPPSARSPRPRPSPAPSATRCWSAPPTCWAAGPCRSSTTSRTSCAT